MAQLAARRIPDPKVGGSTPSSFIRHNKFLTQYLNRILCMRVRECACDFGHSQQQQTNLFSCYYEESID